MRALYYSKILGPRLSNSNFPLLEPKEVPLVLRHTMQHRTQHNDCIVCPNLKLLRASSRATKSAVESGSTLESATLRAMYVYCDIVQHPSSNTQILIFVFLAFTILCLTICLFCNSLSDISPSSCI